MLGRLFNSDTQAVFYNFKEKPAGQLPPFKLALARALVHWLVRKHKRTSKCNATTQAHRIILDAH
eukprot:1150302-Pelagomonas_calceolata.AAC.6